MLPGRCLDRHYLCVYLDSDQAAFTIGNRGHSWQRRVSKEHHGPQHRILQPGPRGGRISCRHALCQEGVSSVVPEKAWGGNREDLKRSRF